jgi:hypothetical protein
MQAPGLQSSVARSSVAEGPSKPHDVSLYDCAGLVQLQRLDRQTRAVILWVGGRHLFQCRARWACICCSLLSSSAIAFVRSSRFSFIVPSPPYQLAPPGPLYALLSVCRSEPGLSLVGRGYAQGGKSVQAVRGKAWAWVALEVSVPQQFIDQAIAFAPARVHAYADCRSTHGHVWGWLP